MIGHLSAGPKIELGVHARQDVILDSAVNHLLLYIALSPFGKAKTVLHAFALLTNAVIWVVVDANSATAGRIGYLVRFQPGLQVEASAREDWLSARFQPRCWWQGCAASSLFWRLFSTV